MMSRLKTPGKGKGKYLSDHEKQHIERRWKEQAFIGEIARELGREHSAIRRHLANRGLI
jgi:IS30 family transposase